MNNKVMYMTFYENWVEVMEMCTPEEWYELCKIITNLRFKGIDTDAKTISNLKIKMAWNLIRPSILKSNRDKRYNDTKRNGGNAEETKKSVITEVKTTEFDIPNCQISNTGDLSPSNDKEVEQPQPIVDNTTESLKTGKEQEIPKEFMEGLTNSTEDEMVEVLMSDEELIEYVANKFIKTEGEDAYDMFIKLNSVNPKSDEFRALSNRWKFKWERYITTEKRKSLAEKITDIVWEKYYQRYKKVS